MNEHQTDDVYNRFCAELDSGLLFEYAERSHAGRALFSRGRGWMKQIDNKTANAIVRLGQLAERNRALLDVTLAILKQMNPHASIAEWSANLFRTARLALAEDYDDVERRSGPESYRMSECRRPYTRAERLLVLETLRSCCDDWIGPGWCAERLATELGITLPKYERR